ncbi:MAG: nucleoside phosphorylase [Mariniphaga sp.]|nr:nucleoside phosphorylase [Mariniphaga sp.]
MTKKIAPSELILNADGSIFHLHLKPGQIASDIILVGDPGRVEMIAGFFDEIELKAQNREFVTITGRYKGKRITVLSTGIGTDNIDIVVNELDALVNIDLETREIKADKTSLNIIRIGTSGALQGDIPVDAFLVSRKAIGFDGLMNFYARREEFADLPFENAFKSYTNWNPLLASPYVVDCNHGLYDKITDGDFIPGITISAPGFYGPQGRELRLNIIDRQINDKIEAFRFDDMKITNYEMECSAIYGLSKLLGHQALTVCIIIANRISRDASSDYQPVMKRLVVKILDKLTQ